MTQTMLQIYQIGYYQQPSKNKRSCFTLINLSFDEQDVLYLEAVVREALI